MLITQKRYGIPIRKHYFSPISPTWRDYVLPSAYMDYYTEERPKTFSTEYRHTLITDLRRDEDEIFQSFPKDTRNQIRRCEREQHFELNLDGNLESFTGIYNRFAASRGLSPFDPEDAGMLQPENHLLLAACKDGKAIICHFYLISKAAGIANLLMSVSDIHYNDDPEMRRIIGHANRCLHWQGMRHLKAEGFHTYDWGGYMLETDDPAMQGINRFKKTFNGTLTPTYNHYSPTYVFIDYMRHKLRKSRR